MEVRAIWNGRMGFVATGNTNHATVMDVSKAVGGDESASSPMEMVLFGLAGCTGADVASIMRKKRLKVDDFQIFIKAKRADEHPKVYTKIDLTFEFKGNDLSEKALKSAVELSMNKYCSVSAMLSKTAEINWEVVVRE